MAKLLRTFLCLLFLVFAKQIAAQNAITTYDFSTAPTNSGGDRIITIGGVNFVITAAVNGTWQHSTSGGNGSSASLSFSAAGGIGFSIKREDGKRFQFYGAWLKYTNPAPSEFYKYPWLTVSYSDALNQQQPDFYDRNTTVTISDKNVNVTSVSFLFSGLNVLNLDDIRVGPAIGTAAIVQSLNPTYVSSDGAKLGFSISSDGGSDVSAKGVVYSTSPTFDINTGTVVNYAGNHKSGVIDVYSLNPNTTYYYKAFVTNSHSTAYGDVKSFTTLASNIVRGVYSSAEFSKYGTTIDSYLLLGDDGSGEAVSALKFPLSIVSKPLNSAKLKVSVAEFYDENPLERNISVFESNSSDLTQYIFP
ncbi:hypothetical protein EIM50_21940, partial [Pseudoxanthomonas sp. SGD-10]